MTAETWWSKRGTPLSPDVLSRVDRGVLAQLYAAEDADRELPNADNATFLAWRLGYANPRTADTGEAGA